jgi:hypothetical protein
MKNHLNIFKEIINKNLKNKIVCTDDSYYLSYLFEIREKSYSNYLLAIKYIYCQ